MNTLKVVGCAALAFASRAVAFVPAPAFARGVLGASGGSVQVVGIGWWFEWTLDVECGDICLFGAVWHLDALALFCELEELRGHTAVVVEHSNYLLVDELVPPL